MSPQNNSLCGPKPLMKGSTRFSAAQRVRRSSEFRTIQASRVRAVTPGFVFLAVLSDRSSPARLGVTASRRVGCAVVRNRAKRLVREAFRATAELWPSGVDLVVIVRHSTGSRKLPDVEAEWRSSERKFQRMWKKLAISYERDSRPLEALR